MASITRSPAANGDCTFCSRQPSFTGGAAFGAIGNSVTWPNDNSIRIPNVTIPQGATITSAVLTLYAQWNYPDNTVSCKIYADDVDNATAPTNTGTFAAMVARKTTAFVAWPSMSAWTYHNAYSPGDLVVVVQEIVNRAGWVSGNALQLIILDDGSTNNKMRDYDAFAAGSFYPTLHVIYIGAPTSFRQKSFMVL